MLELLLQADQIFACKTIAGQNLFNIGINDFFFGRQFNFKSNFELH